ncbi:polysaccharide biosynthesis tyrosine autokinase [Paraburkholderia saeva]|uniref:polysaccharide biosynthesis tyrosine autokinase n=1 Tax=Paraburkholderia saeva TaxID=2777537 RepID=UPI001D7CD845|nr:polysaccharide biosynthesis tyrosine autokinase [Paraburkholderia saeva]CAG4898757.1 Tyrosine-protein kinase ptk [Paraburkholderia saeva]
MNQANMSGPIYEPMRQRVHPLHHLSTLYGGRWLILGTTLAFLLCGIAYATFTRPVYRSDMLIQVEQNPNESKSPSGDVSSMFDVKTDASAEIEVLKSRMVVSRAVENLRLYIEAAPRYVPVVGWWFASRADGLSHPLPGGYLHGNESIDVKTFNVPDHWYGKPFVLTLGRDGTYVLRQSGWQETETLELHGKVGEPLRASTRYGPIELLVPSVSGEPGASFTVKRKSEVATTEWFQKAIAISEKGKQSNIIGATLDGTDPVMDSQILNEIGNAYVLQNVQRKSEEADKSIRFLDEQLPKLKAQLEASESRFNAFRAAHGTVDTSQEGTALLQQSVDAQARVLELKQKREDLMTRFTEKHPALQAVDSQLQDAQTSLAAILARTRGLPILEQGVLQLQRDVQVDTDLYTNLLNTRQQLTLVRAGKVGNVRLIDPATQPESPIQPRRGVAVGGSLLAGLLLGVGLAVFRRRVIGAVEDPQEIEVSTGLMVYATVPRSRLASYTRRDGPEKSKDSLVLTHAFTHDAAIESLRTFRTTLQFSLLDAPNRVVLITGPTAGIGKSFVSANLATLAGASNRRVLLIDADLRKGLLHQHFRLDRTEGLSEVVVGTHRFEDVLHRNVSPGLDFLSTGGMALNPSELLLQPELAELVERVASRYDMVVIDGPPLLLVADALVLGRMAGTVFMVARQGVTTVPEIGESARRLAQADVEIRGVIFNDFRGGPGRYGYAYGNPGSYGSAGYTQQ